jgi:membrane protein implicated in regulation of membrane protease activity
VKVWVKYLLLQIPGWALAAILLGALYHWSVLPRWAVISAWAIYVAKDFVLYPYVRRGYESDGKTAAEAMIGSVGIVKQPLEPEGYVQVRGELWRACAELQETRIPAGSRVRVVAANGLTLLVREDRDPGERGAMAEDAR